MMNQMRDIGETGEEFTNATYRYPLERAEYMGQLLCTEAGSSAALYSTRTGGSCGSPGH